MRTSTCILYALVAFAALCHVGLTSPIVKRQVLDNPHYIDPANQDIESDDQDRGKRKIEGAVELKYGAKNAILGLFFNKINQFIDQKTAWVNQLDQINVQKNIQYGIEAPKDPITSFGNVFGSHATYAHLLKPKLFFRHKRAIGVAPPVTPAPKRETTTEDIVLFTPGERVSLEVPDQLFGSGYTLITNISEIVGNLIQNSADRTARIFESMKPFLQGVFGVKSITITNGASNNKV